jgi:hypothetical protein
MHPIPFSLLLLLATAVHAQVYRGVDADGQTVYSDRPLPNGRQLSLPPTEETPVAAEASAEDAGDAGFPGPYEMVQILTPGDDHRVQGAQAELPVSLAIVPALMDSHRLLIEVDGAAVEGDLPNPAQIILRGLGLGSHRLRGRIADADGATVATTPMIDIHVLPPAAEGTSPPP